MKKTIIIIIFIFFYGCEKKTLIITEDVAEKLSMATYKKPSVYGQEKLFVLTNSNQVILTNADSLNYLYQLHYKKSYKYFKNFLLDVLNQKIKISKNDFEGIPYKVFIINKKIEKVYQTGFNNIYNQYTKKLKPESKRIILQTEKLNNEEFLTIQYYFYLNGYQVQEDDYSGFYYVIER